MSTEHRVAIDSLALMSLMQLASSALPVGAYSYSEGLEYLTETAAIRDSASLCHWLEQELSYGAVRLEAGVMVRAYQAADLETVQYWNRWLSAAKETSELRQQSWQMGYALVRLCQTLQPTSRVNQCASPCNFAIAFSLAAAHWQIPLEATILGYLHSWASNLIGAAVKLIPLGQTAGQQLLLHLQPQLCQVSQEILSLEDDQLTSFGWGLALASMAHETQYTRLFRS
jgi:urease accessory protein